jgi:hypothetical protein
LVAKTRRELLNVACQLGPRIASTKLPRGEIVTAIIEAGGRHLLTEADLQPTRKGPRPMSTEERARRAAERSQRLREAREVAKVEPDDHDEVLALRAAAQAAIGHLTLALHTGAISRAHIHACAALTALHQIRA